MKHLKFLVLLCGGGLLGLLIASGLQFEDNPGDTVIMLVAYALPTLMGLMAVAMPPLQSWQGAIALSGFGVAAVRTRVWSAIGGFGDLGGKEKAAVALLVVGVVVSAVVMLKSKREY